MLPLFLSLVVFFFAGSDLYAKPPADAAQQELVEITGSADDDPTTQDLYTVPIDKRLIITDVLVAVDNISGTEATCCVAILRNSNPVSVIDLSDGNYQHTYNSGIEFKTGERVGIRGRNSFRGVFFELRGFQEDIN